LKSISRKGYQIILDVAWLCHKWWYGSGEQNMVYRIFKNEFYFDEFVKDETYGGIASSVYLFEIQTDRTL
jgi:hypothetical protein